MNFRKVYRFTVGSKIIRAIEIICVKKFIPNVVMEINICQVMIFRLSAVYNKHEVIKIGNQPEKTSKQHFKCSHNFAADCI